MRNTTRNVLTLAMGGIIGIAGFNMVDRDLRAADDTRQQRMDQDKWTNADYARDALDHLKKAEQEMHRVAESENSKVAKDAVQACVDARTKVNEFLSLIDAREKKKKN